MATTYTFTGTDTYSVADVKTVMQNTYEDIIGFANRGFVTFEQSKKWINDLTYALNQKVVSFFEIQIRNSIGSLEKCYRYTVDTSGYVSSGSLSGGINYFSFPEGCKAFLLVDLDYSKGSTSAVRQELENRGWGSGNAVEGNETFEKNYVSNNLLLRRSVITKS